MFVKLLALYANAFYLVWPSEKEVNFAKRQYAKEIGRFTREQIDTAMIHLAKLAVSTDRENRIYREPNILAVLAMMDETVKRDRSHQLFLPVPPESQEEKQKRIECGIKNTTALLDMLGADPLPTGDEDKKQRDHAQAQLEKAKSLLNKN